MRNQIITLFAVFTMYFLGGHQAYAQADIDALTQLGKQVFFDTISNPEEVQGCITCHAPSAGWTLNDELINQTQVAAPGAVAERSGNRKPPMISYSIFSPNFVSCIGRSGLSCAGGLFWDGRATGEVIGQEVFAGDSELSLAYSPFLGPAADQALGPFANPVEQNVDPGNTEHPGAEVVCSTVAGASYAQLYTDAWGHAPDCSPENADLSFKRIALAIAAWEHSDEVNSFSSPRDIALANDDNGAFPLQDLTPEENEGHDLFFGAAGCFICHNGVPEGDFLTGSGDEPRQLYSDMAFHHLGLPPNVEMANFDPNNPDRGLGNITGDEFHSGFVRTPSLRNIDKRESPGFTKAYMHNGYFKRLEDVVHFYNTAGIKVECDFGATAEEARRDNCWPAPEFNNGTQASALGAFGNLGLSASQEAAIVAYLRTLSDTLEVQPPEPVQSNRTPVADPQSLVTQQDTAIEITLTGADPDEDPISFAISLQPQSGTLSLDGTSVTFTPSPGFTGIDRFEFTVSDGLLTSTPAEVLIEVIEENTPLVVTDINVETDEDTSVTIDLLETAQGEGLTVVDVSLPSSGVIELNNSELVYTPNQNFCDESNADTFDFTVVDRFGNIATADISVLVRCQTDIPVLNDDFAELVSGTSIELNVLSNDFGIDTNLDSDNLQISTFPANGTVVIQQDGSITYSSNIGFVGTDIFIYEVCDLLGSCATAVVTLNVLEPQNTQSTSASFSPAFADWGSGYCVTLRINNNSTETVTDWSVDADLGQSTIFTSWNGNFSSNSGTTTIAPKFNWNNSIAPGAIQQSIGFCAFRRNPLNRVLPSIISSTP